MLKGNSGQYLDPVKVFPSSFQPRSPNPHSGRYNRRLPEQPGGFSVFQSSSTRLCSYPDPEPACHRPRLSRFLQPDPGECRRIRGNNLAIRDHISAKWDRGPDSLRHAFQRETESRSKRLLHPDRLDTINHPNRNLHSDRRCPITKDHPHSSRHRDSAGLCFHSPAQFRDPCPRLFENIVLYRNQS